MSWWYIVLSHSNKNIITSQKINKISFYVTQNFFSVFCASQFFNIQFYITYWQHLDLLRSDPGSKEIFNPSFTYLSNIPKQLLCKSCSRKKVSYYLGLMFMKRLWRTHILLKLQACFSQILQIFNTITGTFQGF